MSARGVNVATVPQERPAIDAFSPSPRPAKRLKVEDVRQASLGGHNRPLLASIERKSLVAPRVVPPPEPTTALDLSQHTSVGSVDESLAFLEEAFCAAERSS
mmetsp:Transcript_55943/g.181584  ORF Transcript_55943/g.181584 Transcript_55943/m.181584 type:complete len:102 (+) Transcript_55943:95-400(+)